MQTTESSSVILPENNVVISLIDFFKILIKLYFFLVQLCKMKFILTMYLLQGKIN